VGFGGGINLAILAACVARPTHLGSYLKQFTDG
jgi:hypothetical protein